MHLRKATNDDCDILFRWANDSDTRKNSFNQDVIKYDDHINWFNGILSSSEVEQYILCDQRCDVGQIRIAIKDKSAEISYSVAPEFRGKGYGTTILALLEKELQNGNKNVKYLLGDVKIENIASQAAFRKNKYTLIENDGTKGYLTFVKEII